MVNTSPGRNGGHPQGQPFSVKYKYMDSRDHSPFRSKEWRNYIEQEVEMTVLDKLNDRQVLDPKFSDKMSKVELMR